MDINILLDGCGQNLAFLLQFHPPAPSFQMFHMPRFPHTILKLVPRSNSLVTLVITSLGMLVSNVWLLENGAQAHLSAFVSMIYIALILHKCKAGPSHSQTNSWEKPSY